MSWRQLEGHLGWASQGTVPAALLVFLIDGMPMAGKSVKHFYFIKGFFFSLAYFEIMNYYFRPMVLLAVSSKIKLK